MCLVALARHAAAQTVRGVVAEDGTGTRLAGAMVVLFDFDGEAVDRVLSDAGGGFTMRADHPGRYHVRVDRIGYASLTTDPFDVPVRGTFRRIAVPIRPIRIRGLDVSGSRRCEVRPEEGRVTARVWEEARKALEAAAWTQSTGIYRYTLRHFVRDLDRSEERILDENRAFKRGSTNAPFVSVPVEGLIADGFVQEDVESGTIYHAPDAEAFLSDAFIDTHCMGVRRGEAGSIGLVFEPVESRTLPDIEGVLWLDEETAELDRLEFSYVNVSSNKEIGEPGGFVNFTRLPNGTWIVRSGGSTCRSWMSTDAAACVDVGTGTRAASRGASPIVQARSCSNRPQPRSRARHKTPYEWARPPRPLFAFWVAARSARLKQTGPFCCLASPAACTSSSFGTRCSTHSGSPLRSPRS